MSKEENALEEVIQLNEDIAILSQSEKNLANSYITYSYLQNLPSLKERLVFAVKAPSENNYGISKV